jgi:hypothetical protein
MVPFSFRLGLMMMMMMMRVGACRCCEYQLWLVLESCGGVSRAFVKKKEKKTKSVLTGTRQIHNKNKNNEDGKGFKSEPFFNLQDEERFLFIFPFRACLLNLYISSPLSPSSPFSYSTFFSSFFLILMLLLLSLLRSSGLAAGE